MDPSESQLVQVLQAIRTGGYVGYSLLCLVAYEYIITFGQEVAVVWRRKLSVVSVLLLGTRWLMVVNPLIGNFSGPTICRPLYTLTVILWAIITLMISLFPALRIYALWRTSWVRYIFPALILLLGTVAIGTNIFGLTRSVVSYDPALDTCVQSTVFSPSLGKTYANAPPITLPPLTPSPQTYRLVLYLTRLTTIGADVLVLVLTWIRSFTLFREARRISGASSVTVVLLRDGTIYFGAVLIINILQLLTFTAAAGLSTATYAVPFLESLPPLLMQRCMLNLRTLHNAGGDASEAPLPSRLSLAFRAPTLLGDAGGELDYGYGLYSDLPGLSQDELHDFDISDPGSSLSSEGSALKSRALHAEESTGGTVPQRSPRSSLRFAIESGGLAVSSDSAPHDVVWEWDP
ncbi:hypothetical protein PsYK624_125350 [Phanerochaete sordida]|uniref:DUF6533 domain-containing protein n=1 Tax=Phanerochaete sordida TaxID=48140 RepID=A0A9P3LIA5_9APHY|nr:hypothetical protein PsYK624_125350 [Phanerochaete sordida]